MKNQFGDHEVFWIYLIYLFNHFLNHQEIAFRKLLERAISVTKNQDYQGEQVRLLMQEGDFKAAERITMEVLKDDVITPNAQILMGNN